MSGQPDPNRTLRVALAGAGMISEFHLKAWAKQPGVTLAAITDPDLARAQARARQHQPDAPPRCYPDLAALLQAEQLDALDVASPRETHAALVRQAADHGVDVMCQKPLAPTLAEAEQLVADMAGRIRLMVHENWRFRPYYRQVAAWQREGLLGELTSGSLRLLSSGLVPDATGKTPMIERQPFFRTESRLLVAETLIHHIDTVRWLFGPLRLVHANMRRTTDAVIGETVATLVMETPTGATVLVDGNLTCPGYSPITRDRAEFIGTRGSVTLQADKLVLHGPVQREVQYVHDQAYQACFDAAIAHFVQALRTGAPFETDGAENLDTLRLVDEAYRMAGWQG